jgi:hypothetical protein
MLAQINVCYVSLDRFIVSFNIYIKSSFSSIIFNTLHPLKDLLQLKCKLNNSNLNFLNGDKWLISIRNKCVGGMYLNMYILFKSFMSFFRIKEI